MTRNKIFSFLSPLFIYFLLSSVSFPNGHDLLKEATVSTEGAKNLVINSFAGSISVTGSDRSYMTMQVFGKNKNINDFEILTAKNVSSVALDCKKKNEDALSDENDFGLKIVVNLPDDKDVSVKSGNGNIIVRNIGGKLRVYTGGGNIDITNVSKNIYAVTAGGNVSAENVDGSVNIISGGGNIDVINFVSTVIALTDGGNIFLKGSNGAINASTGGGNIDVDYLGKNSGMVLNSGAGNINLNLPVDFEADVSLLTENGKISGDVSNTKNKNFIQTIFNGGGKKLYCLTETGNIVLYKKRA